MAETYRVVMRNRTADSLHEATDPFVPADQVEAYVQDARTRWSEVVATPNESE